MCILVLRYREASCSLAMDRESTIAPSVSGVEHTGESSGHQQTERVLELIDGMWRDLSGEVLEQALPFLTVPDLCRYRSVCKSWNSLICRPEFGSLCTQDAITGVSQGACFVVKLRLLVEECETGRRCAEVFCWSIFDLNTRRWYNVKGELPEGGDQYKWAMDGGLLCTFVNASTEEQRRASTVDNPYTSESQIGWLYEYNFEDDAWEATGVKFSDSNIHGYGDGVVSCDLVVALNRLYLTRQRTGKDQDLREQVDQRDFLRSGQRGGQRRHNTGRKRESTSSWLLDISEISLSDKFCQTVVEMREK